MKSSKCDTHTHMMSWSVMTVIPNSYYGIVILLLMCLQQRYKISAILREVAQNNNHIISLIWLVK